GNAVSFRMILLRIIRGVLWAIIGLPFHFGGVIDEAFHRWIGIPIEGGKDDSSSFLIGILLGLQPATTEYIRPSEMRYQKYPWLRGFSILAAPLGWLMFLLLFGTLLGLHLAGLRTLSGWWLYFVIYMTVLSATSVVANLVLTREVSRKYQ